MKSEKEKREEKVKKEKRKKVRGHVGRCTQIVDVWVPAKLS